MNEESCSWVRRAKFSHTIYHRFDLSQLPSRSTFVLSDRDHEQRAKISKFELAKFQSTAASSTSNFDSTTPKMWSSSLDYSSLHSDDFSSEPCNDSRSSLQASNFGSSDFSFHPDHDPKMELKASNPELVASSVKAFEVQHSNMSYLFKNKPTQRPLSPLPTSKLSETFKEARAEGNRFSTPPPSRKSSEKGVLRKFFSREARDHRLFNAVAPSETFPRNFSVMNFSDNKDHKDMQCSSHSDHGERATFSDTTNEWMVDLSKLYLGLKFASGAHSRLYHGIYKDQPVAVKLIRQPDDDENGELGSRLEKQFCREVTLLSHLYHQNVIKLVAACRKPPVFYVITEYLSGGSLRAFLHKMEGRSLPLRKLISIALNIARGMEYIHSQGVIHRDLEPENIIFDEDFCIRIADFGIAYEEAYCDGWRLR